MNKSLPAQIVSPGKAFGILCFVNLAGTKSPIATKISETEVVNEIKRFGNTTHVVAKELESAAEALKNHSYLDESKILRTHVCMLQDKYFLEKVGEKIKNDHVAADIAQSMYCRRSQRCLRGLLMHAFRSGWLFRKLHRKDTQLFQTITRRIEVKPVFNLPAKLRIRRPKILRFSAFGN